MRQTQPLGREMNHPRHFLVIAGGQASEVFRLHLQRGLGLGCAGHASANIADRLRSHI
jgi:hypothetical protein